MISRDEIEWLGFTRVDNWSSDIIDSYKYIVNRYDKPRNTINLYRLDKLIGTDYIELKSTLQRETDFCMNTYSYNGEVTSIEDLFDLVELIRDHNRIN